MTNGKTLGVGMVILIIGLGLGYALGGGSYQPLRGGHMMQNGSMMNQNIDQHFIAEMIPHHEGAIAMAKIALERSKRPEMLSLANAIIEAQQKEIDAMHDWYREWFDEEVPEDGGMGMHMGGMEGDVSVLTSIPQADFDREFIEQMIPHHEMAIMMARMLQSSTDRGEMKQLAENIITSQSREIEMMRGWLKVWYGQ